ncbi:hypothetical protein C1646_774623, partial [Rhizophagus diaphanus]
MSHVVHILKNEFILIKNLKLDIVKDEETNFNNSVLGILEHSHDIPQIRLWELLNGISYNDITEIWKVSNDMPSSIQGAYSVRQWHNAIFHISHIHTWFNLSSDPPTNSTDFITIVNSEKNHTMIPLSYMNQLRIDNIYTLTIREKVNKKIQYGVAMSIVKTSIQIAVTEDVTAELIGILTYHILYSIGLSFENTKNFIFFSGTESLQDSQGSSIQDNLQLLSILPDISNPEYHKPKGQPPKWYKSMVENNRIISGKPDDVT